MANDAAILAKMRSAHVPPHSFPHSLKTLRQLRFASIIQEKRFELQGGGLESFVVRPSKRKDAPHVSLVAGVAAKELVLLNKKVFYGTLAGTILSLKDWANIDAGHGYFVLADLGQNTQNWPANDWDSVQAYLMSHLSRGGGLILGDNGVIENGWLGAELAQALTVFEEITVE